MNQEPNSKCCIKDILEVIVKLQNCSESIDCGKDGCDRPFLGPVPSSICYNTRPIRLYRCSDGNLWTFNYNLNGNEGTSSVFRVEQVDGCCATCRILAENPDEQQQATYPYVSTNNLFTINLCCVGALTCLSDTYIIL